MEKDNRPVHIEDLNKTQLILLVILLSFVTSIATGVIAAALVEQASPQTTQTINRVVQRTIEKVTTESPGETIVQTVIVKEGDLVVDAVDKARKTFFPLRVSGSSEIAGTVYSLGNGFFVAPSSLVAEDKTYTVTNEKSVYTMKTAAVTPYGLTILSVANPDASVKSLPVVSNPKDTEVKAGQTVVAVSSSLVNKDIIQSLRTSSIRNEEGTMTASWNAITLSSSLPPTFIGAVLVDIDANAIGFVGRRDTASEIVSTASLLSFVSRATVQ